MVFGIFGLGNDNGKVIMLIEKNALKIEDSQNKIYYLWSDKGNLHHIKYFPYARQTKGGNYIARIEIDSTPPEAKIPKKLEEILKIKDFEKSKK